MGEPEQRARPVAAELATAAAVLALAVALSWARIEFNHVYLPGALENVAGLDPRGAAEPFAHRVLVPKLVRFLCEHVFAGAAPLTVFRVLDPLFVVAAFYALRRLAREAFAARWAVTLASFGLFPLLACHYVLSREYPFWYAWDMSAVAVFTYGLWLLRRREWLVYYLLFALGTFNRETTCFLTVTYVLTAWRDTPRLRLAAHAAAQLALWLAIKALLRSLYRRQPGDVYQSVWLENWESLLDPAMWRWFLLAFGGLWLALPFLVRRIADPWLRAALWVVPVYALGMFFAGVWTELRIWGELIPVVVLSFVAGCGGRAIAAPRPAA